MLNQGVKEPETQPSQAKHSDAALLCLSQHVDLKMAETSLGTGRLRRRMTFDGLSSSGILGESVDMCQPLENAG